jgi:hypothetical protein
VLINFRKANIIQAGSLLGVHHFAAAEFIRGKWSVQEVVICEDVTLHCPAFVIAQLLKTGEETARAERTSKPGHRIV